MFFWNKVEVYLSYNFNHYNEARQKLNNQGIAYRSKVYNPHSGLFNGRGERGSFGMRSGFDREYRIYVSQEDVELAKHVIYRA